MSMRVLFCSSGSLGHLRPMLPLAMAFRQEGHRVAWASSPDALPGLAGSGYDLFPVGIAMAAARALYRQRWPEAASMSGLQLSTHTFPHLFGGVVAPAMVDDLGRVIDRWMPDLLVHEPAALAVPLICASRGLVHVCHGYGLRPPAGHLSGALREFSRQQPGARQLPADDGGIYRHRYIDIVPRRLQAASPCEPDRVLALSPAPAAGTVAPDLPPAWLRRLASNVRPILYLSFGTVFNRGPAFGIAARALSRLDATVVVTMGSAADARLLGPLPANVWIEGFVDQQALLPLCAAVVSHGGSGTLLGAAAFGLPQLVLPQAADQFRNAAALAAAGAGLVLGPEDCTEDAVAGAARALLEGGAIRHAARQLGADIAQMPAAADVVRALLDHGATQLSPS
ncbi:MAG: glycosyltransferase family 1 protein [Burkholderiaceae bacterium]|nr:glycosyltransferase family 1 protein [Burkholderiaceae bacterium]